MYYQPAVWMGSCFGKKLYETLVNREEMVKAIDLENYYKIPADTRDLNYDKYFLEGAEDVSMIEDYHSHNTKRLNVEELMEMLLNLEYIKNELK